MAAHCAVYAIEEGTGWDKKFISPKLCIWEKFRLQKVGVTKVFYSKSGVQFWFWQLYGKMIAALPGYSIVREIFSFGHSQ